MNPHQHPYAAVPGAPRPPPPAAYVPSPSPATPFPLHMQHTPADSSAYSRATSTDPGSAGVLTGDVGTPLAAASEDESGSGANTPAPDDSLAATPAPATAPAKRSKALNFLKKKETKVNVKGTSYKIVDDEIILEEDARGEAKIDDNGYLLGGRNWKVHTFTSPMRTNPDKLYMLSIDAARCAGFRDSLYFFRRNPLIHKLSCSQAEKDRLIELGKLSGNLKSRAVTMVSARNVFKVMGATFVQDGKYILDDYYEGKSLAAGHKPGEPAFIEPYDPEKDTGTLAVSKGNAPPGATSLGLNVLIGHPGKPKMPGSELISSQIGGGLHATFGGNGLAPYGKSSDPSAKKAKPASHLTVEDWMYEYAKEVSETNRRFAVVRKSHVGQVAISLGVQEKEEDCWEMVEEEYTDDEHDVKPVAAPGQLPPAPSYPQLPPNRTPSQPPTVTLTSSSMNQPPPPPAPAPFDSALPALYGASPQPSTSAPPPPPPSSYKSVPSRLPSHVPPPPPAPAVARPKKKRMTRRFNPIRGFYELETNVPHVYRSTQPTTVLEVYRADVAAHIFPYHTEGERLAEALGDETTDRKGGGSKKQNRKAKPTTTSREERARLRELELAGATRGAGIASVEFVSCPARWNSEDPTLGAREPLVPGMWEFQVGPDAVAELSRGDEGQAIEA
ncbi:hypothetical protein JCM11491_003441 [Sporobolomyces phaffii]